MSCLDIRHCERSEAIYNVTIDCRVASNFLRLLAMTIGCLIHD
jgi:hypothetical protein